MSALPKRYFTPEEYLLLEERAPYKSQYVAGEIFPMGEDTSGPPSVMGGAKFEHTVITTNLTHGLHALLRPRGCWVFGTDMRVAVAPGEVYTYSDVSVLCGEPKLETARNPPSLLNPQVVFEILSPTTEAFDRGLKFEHYRRLASLTDYVLVSTERMLVEHYTRQPDNGVWSLRIIHEPEARVRFAGLDCEMTLAAIYDRVTFPPKPF